MTDAQFLCSLCTLELPSAAELAEHLRLDHEPTRTEDDIELVARAGAAAPELERARLRLAADLPPGVSTAMERAMRLELCRARAAAAIADRSPGTLRELKAELEAIHVAAAQERDRQTEIAATALHSAELLAAVLGILSGAER